MNNNITKVCLLDVPLENDYKNTLYFTSKASQTSYFQSKIVSNSTNWNDFSYQRKDQKIRVPLDYDDIYNCNYVMYQNTKYSDKWFYAFITKIEYVSDGRSDVYIETDVIQTWLFDYQLKASFVEREHTDNDTIGSNTLPENLELGEYISEGVQNSNPGNSHLVIAATYDVFADEDAGGYYNGIYSGVDYFLIGGINPVADPSTPSNSAAIQYFLKAYAGAGKSDAITGLFIVPDKITGYESISSWDYMFDGGGLLYYPYKKLGNLDTTGADFGDISITKPYSTVNGYTPRNNKLFTYPYKYLKGTNNSGAAAIYQYEYFSDSTFKFKTKGSITPGCSIRTYPLSYKGVTNYYDEGISYGKYPVCSFNTDMYINWLTQNGVNIALNLVSGATQIAGGVGMAIATGGIGMAVGGGAVAGGVGTIANTLAQVYEHSLIPPQAEGNLNNGDINYSMGINKIMFYKMSIRSEYAQIIDKYFDMFGYKTNLVKVPNSAHRSRWWYTKTIDVNIDGNIPQEDMQKIKNAYNNGITFWRNASEIQNYSLSNGIV